MNVQNGRMPGELDRHLGRRIGTSLLLVIGLAVSLFGFVEDASAMLNALEWCYALLMVAAYPLTAMPWRHTGFRSKLAVNN